MRVLVCGSRDWSHHYSVFTRLQRLPTDAVVIHGASSRIGNQREQSADMIADGAARLLDLRVERFHANWERYGRHAGLERNLEMLDTNPDLVIAFQRNRSRGTQHTIDQARKRGIAVEVIRWEDLCQEQKLKISQT